MENLLESCEELRIRENCSIKSLKFYDIGGSLIDERR